MKPYRSMLFVPGHKPTWAEKAVASGTDALILDLEDSVPAADKADARKTVRDTIERLHDQDAQPDVWVRPNSVDSGLFGADVEEVLVEGLAGLFVPKVFTAEEVVRIDAVVSTLSTAGRRRAVHAPLDGITVVALEQAISAPLCTRHLADLGARVIKVENPGVGDTARHYDGVVRGMAAHFVWLNHGKESVELNLADPDDGEVFVQMLAKADVLVSNLAPGALGRLGLDPTDLAQRYPRLIVVDISGYGTGGPLDHKRAYDLLVQAEGGSCAITGWPGAPAKSGVPVADIGTALYAYSAVLAALYDREHTGRGAVIPVARASRPPRTGVLLTPTASAMGSIRRNSPGRTRPDMISSRT